MHTASLARTASGGTNVLGRVMRRGVLVSAMILAGCEPAATVEERPVAQGPATLAVAGDAMLGRAFNGLYEADPGYLAFRDLEAAMADVDVISFNLETTITTSEDIWEGKNYNFKLDPSHAASALGSVPGAASVPRVLSLANNHVLDFGIAGMRETVETLDAQGVLHVGAGENEVQAREPLVLTTADGVTIGIISAASVCSCGGSWGATSDMPGMWQFSSSDPSELAELVEGARALRPEVDWLVLTLHWGENWTEEWPIPWMRGLAEELADAGVDLIVGHSSHHVLPVERFGSTIVLNGMGDFLDDYSPREGFRNDLSYVGRVSLVPGVDPALEVVPLRIEHEGGHWVHPIEAADPDHAWVLAATESLQ